MTSRKLIIICLSLILAFTCPTILYASDQGAHSTSAFHPDLDRPENSYCPESSLPLIEISLSPNENSPTGPGPIITLLPCDEPL